MELFAIVLSFPFLFVVTSIYSYVLKRAASRWSWIYPLFWRASASVLGLFVLEFIGVMAVGPLELRKSIGATFYPIHLVLFLLAVPALANIMRLQKKSRIFSFWVVTALLCAIFGVCVVVLQYHVSETLYGIEGEGPYSY